MDWQTKVAHGSLIQRMVNGNPSLYRATDMSAMAERVEVGQGYMQYVGHFDWWFKVRVNKDVTTKMGQAFKAGDVTIGTFSELEGQKRLCVMSWRNGYVSTIIPLDYAVAW